MLNVFPVESESIKPVTEPKFDPKPSNDDRNTRELGPEADRSQLKTNEVAVKLKPAFGETVN